MCRSPPKWDSRLNELKAIKFTIMTRKKFTAKFKTRVVLEVLKERKTNQELARDMTFILFRGYSRFLWLSQVDIIIFLIYTIIFHTGINSLDELVPDIVDDFHFMLSLIDFSQVVISEFTWAGNSANST